MARAECLSHHVRAHQKIATLHRDYVARLMGGLERQWVGVVEFLKQVRAWRSVCACGVLPGKRMTCDGTVPYGLQNVVGPLHECFVALDAVGGLRSPTNLSHAADIVSRIKAVTQAMVASATSATMTVDRDFDALRRRYAQRCQQVQDALAKAEQQQAVLERNQAGWDGVGADGVQAGAPQAEVGGGREGRGPEFRVVSRAEGDHHQHIAQR